MAKQSAGPEAAAQVAAKTNGAADSVPAPADTRSAFSAGASQLQSIVADKVEVVEWDTENGVPKSVTERPAEGAPVKKEAAPEDRIEHPDAKPKVTETSEEPTPADKPKTEADPAKVDETAAAKRKAIFANLEAEKTKRAIEQQATKAQDDAKAARDEMARIQKAPLKEKLAWLGIDPDELADKLLIKADDVQFETKKPEPKAPERDPEVAALLKWKADREAAEQTQQIASAHAAVADALKDNDGIPITSALGKWGEVLELAHDAWSSGGKAGHVRDYLGDAAEMVEQGLRKTNPSLAALADKARGEKPTVSTEEDAPVATKPAPAPRVAAGTRTAATPGTKPKELPDDPLEKDAAIKAEFRRLHPSEGW